MGQLTVDLGSKIKDLEPRRTHKALPVAERSGVTFPRYFTRKLEAGKTPYDEVQWETRTATIGNDKGAVIFEQRDVEVPADWSQTATNIVASKYFHGKLGSPERETQRRGTGASRSGHHRRLGHERRLFRDRTTDGENFRNELAHLMLTQKACFNSPVWFNVGVQGIRGYGWYLRRSTRTRIKKLSNGSRARSARPASSSRSRTRSNRFSISPRPKACSSSGAPAPAPTSRRLREEDGILSGGGRASGPLSFHEGLRRLRRRHQVRRQDAPRRQDGDPQRRPSRHREASSGARPRKRRRPTP